MNVLDEILQELRTLRGEHADLKRMLQEHVAPQATDAPMTVDEAAALLRMSKHTVRKRCAEGKIPHSSTGRGARLYFLRSDLMEYLKKHRKRLATEEAKDLMRGKRK